MAIALALGALFYANSIFPKDFEAYFKPQFYNLLTFLGNVLYYSAKCRTQ